MHKPAIFQLLNIEIVFILAFLANVYTNKYFVVVVGDCKLACAKLSFSTLRYTLTYES